MEFCLKCGKELMTFPQEENKEARVFACLRCDTVFVGRMSARNNETRVVIILKTVTCRQLLIIYQDADSNLKYELSELLRVCGKRDVDEKIIHFAATTVSGHLISSAARGNKPKLPHKLEQTLKIWVSSIPIYDF